MPAGYTMPDTANYHPLDYTIHLEENFQGMKTEFSKKVASEIFDISTYIGDYEQFLPLESFFEDFYNTTIPITNKNKMQRSFSMALIVMLRCA